jgi:hypothetical protein
MKKIIFIISLILVSCATPKKCCAQIDYKEYLQDFDLEKTLKHFLF